MLTVVLVIIGLLIVFFTSGTLLAWLVIALIVIVIGGFFLGDLVDESNNVPLVIEMVVKIIWWIVFLTVVAWICYVVYPWVITVAHCGLFAPNCH